MRLFLLVFAGVFLNAQDCSNKKKCTCQGLLREIQYVEEKFVIDPMPFPYEGTLIISDSIEKKPKLNRHIVYLNNCTDYQIEPTDYFNFNVYQKDIDAWKLFIEKNCFENGND